MKTLFRYIRPFWGRVAGGMTIKFIGSIMDLLLPYILAYLLDTVCPHARATGSTRMIFFYGGIMLLCSFVAWGGNVIANRMAAGVARDVTRALRLDLFDKTMRLSEQMMNDYSVPTLESRLTGDTYNVHHFVGMMQRMGIRAPILLIGGIVLTSMMEPVLTLVLLLTLPIIALVVYVVTKKGVPLYTILQQRTDDMVRVIRENITGVRVIKALSKGNYERARFARVNQAVSDGETRAGATMAITSPVMRILLNGGLTAVVFVGAVRVNSGVSQVGKIIAFMSYFTIILNAMMSITRLFIMYSKGAASADRIAEILAQPNEKEVLVCTDLPPSEDRGGIVFDHVSFSYGGKRADLSDISFSLPAGGTLGVIGATGSGKSTLVKLLLRFYDPNEGNIYLFGENIKSMPIDRLRRKFGVALQNDFLFADSIYENIRFERDIEKSRLEKAAASAQAEAFIRERADGFEEMLSAGGHNLSGGQRQRLLIARALAGDPEILILDDASSALDYRTDAALRKSISEMTPGPTAVLIAQRVSTVRGCDVIVVLDGGEAVAVGDHDTLMKTCDIYREIAQMQMGGGINGGTR